jgi:hypothetical protein
MVAKEPRTSDLRQHWSVSPTVTFHGTDADFLHRCDCRTGICTRRATQEDMLCDECRGHCSAIDQ